MSHKFTCALTKVGPYNKPHETVFIDLKEDSMSAGLKSSFENFRSFAQSNFPEGPSIKWLDQRPLPEPIKDHIMRRTFDCLGELNIEAPMTKYREGCNKVKRLNSSGSVMRTIKKAFFLYLLGKEAFFTLHAVRPVNLAADLDQIDPEPSIGVHDIEIDEPVCMNRSCADKIKALELENQSLRQALVKSRSRLLMILIVLSV